MIKGLDLTVYELLGYMLPGTVALSALCLVAGLAEPAVLDATKWTRLGWWVLLPLAAAYVIGHVLQALANRIYGRRSEVPALVSVMGELPASAFEAIARRLRVTDAGKEIEAWQSKDKREAFLALCNSIVDQDAKTIARDVFLYREGFYRGTSLALFALAGSVTLWIWPLWRNGVGTTKCQHVGIAIGVIAILSWSGIEFCQRYKRFVRYRISSSIWGAAMSATASVKGAVGRSDDSTDESGG